ncbi:MAG: acyltransferase [Bacteroidetes bacterium]|nr:acyltransferase [Bacteroidota bacterium]
MIPVLRFFYRGYIFLFHGRCYSWIVKHIPFFKPLYETRINESPIKFNQWFTHKILGNNSGPYWPIHHTSIVSGSWRNIYVGVDAAPGISGGCYIQAMGKIYIDDYTQIAPNVGLISSNHFMLDIRKHVINEIRIGKYCRIGMGSIILPGVVLGDFTTVSAGSIVTRSFPQGYCVISGNPAKIVQDYSQNDSIKMKFVKYKNLFEYNGFIPSSEFNDFRKNHLNV